MIRKTKEKQGGKTLPALRAIAGLIACICVILFIPLTLCDIWWLRWPVFVIVSFIAMVRIDILIDIYLRKERKGGCLLFILFVLSLLLCENTSTYREEKGYERKGVIVDAEITYMDSYTERGMKHYELYYAFRVDGKVYKGNAGTSHHPYGGYPGMTIPVIYNSDHPKISRLEDHTPRYNLFLAIEKISREK